MTTNKRWRNDTINLQKKWDQNVPNTTHTNDLLNPLKKTCLPKRASNDWPQQNAKLLIEQSLHIIGRQCKKLVALTHDLID